MRRTLQNILCGTLLFTLSTFLSMKNADGQTTQIHNITMKEADKEMDRAQNIYSERLNTLHLGFQPTDFGLSIGYSRRITPQFGLYSFLSKGTYIAPPDFLSDNFEKSRVGHFKISLGGMLYTRIDYYGKAFIIGGSTYSFNNKKNYRPGSMNEKGLRKLSFEFGAGATIEKIGVGVLFDAFKGESNIFLNFAF